MKQGELRLQATCKRIDQVNAFVEGFLEEIDCPPKAAMQLMVAVEELYVNIASYAYAPASGDALIRLSFAEEDRALSIAFIDWGIPFDPVAKADPDVTLSADEREIGGLGIFMVKKTMDAFTYARQDGQNIVTIVKKL